MIKKIKENVWQLNFHEFGSLVYVLIIGSKKILIDTGSPANKQELMQDFTKLKINPIEIDTLILTHNHYDHTGNIDLFPRAEVYGSKRDFKDDEDIEDIDNLDIKEFQIIKTPGHTKGGICILYEDVLFSGDTIFDNGGVGRTDLPRGNFNELEKSIESLENIKYKILCPGHLV